MFGPPKNGRPRTLSISEEMVRLLKKHRAHQNRRKRANRHLYRDRGLVFAKDWEDMQRETDCLGDPLQINNIAERQFDPLQEKAVQPWPLRTDGNPMRCKGRWATSGWRSPSTSTAMFCRTGRRRWRLTWAGYSMDRKRTAGKAALHLAPGSRLAPWTGGSLFAFVAV